MSTPNRRDERPYVNGLTWSTLSRLLSWLALSIPLAVVAMGVAPEPEPMAAPPEPALESVSARIVKEPGAQAEVDLDFEFADTTTPPTPPVPATPPALDAPPWPLSTFLGDNVVHFQGSASDLFAAGNLVTVGGEVTGNAFVAGQTVDLRDGTVAGDLFVAGETLTIDQGLAGDVYMAGGNCRLDADAEIRGNLYMGCGTAVLDGAIGGSIVGGGGEVLLNGPVGGDVDLEVGALELGPQIAIRGDLDYTAPERAEGDEGDHIGGTTTWSDAPEHAKQHTPPDHHDGPGFFGFWFMHTWGFISALIVGFVLLAMLGPTALRSADALVAQPGKSLGIGFAALVLVPVVAVIAIVLLVTMPLGFGGLMLYAIAAYVATLIPALALGQLIWQRSFGKDDPSPYASLALGLLILHLLFAIPFFGFLLQTVAVSAGLGAMYLLRNGNGASVPDPA